MRVALKALALICLTLMPVRGASPTDNSRRIDEYGAITCEDEMARLDNFAIEVRSYAEGHAVVIVYGGRRDTKRDEMQARMAYVRHYLTTDRGIDRERVEVFNGGFREHFTVELYVIPTGADAKPLIMPTVPGKDVRFKRGKTGSRIRACSGIG
jgi:hypothetical protein